MLVERLSVWWGQDVVDRFLGDGRHNSLKPPTLDHLTGKAEHVFGFVLPGRSYGVVILDEAVRREVWNVVAKVIVKTSGGWAATNGL